MKYSPGDTSFRKYYQIVGEEASILMHKNTFSGENTFEMFLSCICIVNTDYIEVAAFFKKSHTLYSSEELFGVWREAAASSMQGY